MTGRQWGRSRLTVTYQDGTRQAIHYFVIKPNATVLADLGQFLSTRQWYDDPKDPFKRGPSIMTFDRDRNSVVLQDQRVWMAGLSDEGGAGAWLALIMKQLGAPNGAEVEKFERFVTQTLDGRLQVNQGPEQFGVRKSLFYYEPSAPEGASYDPTLNWTLWSAWRKSQADSVVRSFNYVHVAAAHWVLYRACALSRRSGQGARLALVSRSRLSDRAGDATAGARIREVRSDGRRGLRRDPA